ncbi:DUF2975 domain-containing protein [Myroides pelagicus]|uniref:DUF2975 domain-containing protein n=1 Tax=Myroides pelagicus TaxID=270914 RepID=A0A7K1GKN2_9FLAO|nr:DUF2975 domain-containing protein [Myroides pelagicus]MEC4113768.1 DUF2975 domain-containing protein [Myroides pelagicus]MTH28774.1 DUF2975 domain-containing protein [Myroides pelagicus]
MKQNKPIKFRIFSIILVIIYAFTIISHFGDLIKGFKDGYNEFNENSLYNNTTFLKVERQIPTEELQTLESSNYTIALKNIENTSEVLVEFNTLSPFYNFVDNFLMFFGVVTLIAIIISVFVLLKFLQQMFFGHIASSAQIKRLRYITYPLLSFAVFNTSYILFFNHLHEELLQPFDLKLIKEDIDTSVFFIPIILLVILEVLKQHVKIKEEQELTI